MSIRTRVSVIDACGCTDFRPAPTHDGGDEVSEQPEPYRIPLIRNPRRMGYAVDCTTCGKQIRMGPHSAKSARRLIDMFGALCSECRVEDPA